MASAKERFVAGLYSGAAADGVDAAMVALRGRAANVKAREIHHLHRPFPDALRRRVLEMTSGACEAAGDVAELDRDLAAAFADAAETLIERSGVPREEVTAVGSSGQTVALVPGQPGRRLGAVLELGSPAVIAGRTQRPVVSGFAAAHLAAGAPGGRATAWADWVLLRDQRLSRVAVHLGAIASLTFLGSGAMAGDVLAFDAGPGTILIDALARRFHGRPFDDGGALAARGRPCAPLLNELLPAPFFALDPPKTTPPSDWGDAYLERLLAMARKARCGEADLLATATELTARAVARAIGGLTERPHQVILSGGGAMNIHLAGRIRTLLSPCSTVTVEKFGISLRCRGAVCHAVLAAATLDALRSRGRGGTKPAPSPVPGSVTLPPDRGVR